MDPKVNSYGQGGISPQQPNSIEKRIQVKQLMEPAASLPELTDPLVSELAKDTLSPLTRMIEHSTVLNDTLQTVIEFGAANPISALWMLTADHNLQLPLGGDLAIAKVILPHVADLLKKHM